MILPTASRPHKANCILKEMKCTPEHPPRTSSPCSDLDKTNALSRESADEEAGLVGKDFYFMDDLTEEFEYLLDDSSIDDEEDPASSSPNTIDYTQFLIQFENLEIKLQDTVLGSCSDTDEMGSFAEDSIVVEKRRRSERRQLSLKEARQRFRGHCPKISK